jgi:Transposase
MRFAGIDIGCEVLQWPVSFGEEAAGYRRLRALLGEPADCLIAIEATGHYWKNLVAWLVRQGFAIALVNPIRTQRFAEEELQQTKIGQVDAVCVTTFSVSRGDTRQTAPGRSCRRASVRDEARPISAFQQGGAEPDWRKM